MRFRTVGKGRIIKLFAVAVIFAVIFYWLKKLIRIIEESHCSEEESLHLIQELCNKYKDGIVAGNVCDDLCTTHTIEYKSCTNYRGGKAVLFTECKEKCVKGRTVKAVLKTKYKHLTYDYLHLSKTKDGVISKHAIETTKSIFRERIHSYLKKTFFPNDLFSYVWTMDYYDYVISKDNDIKAEVAALQSIWSLVNQDEYLLIKLYQDLPYIPKLYGSCGGFYLVEFAPPGNMLNPDLIRYDTSPWKDRAKIALQLIELTQYVDKDFFEPFHICDVKGKNFGVDGHKVIKLIDLGTVFFDNDMQGQLSSGTCSKHSDCDFFYCRGWCNITRNKCEAVRTNNNLQSICEDILVDRALNFYEGLLHNPPSAIKTKLNTLLEKCAYPNGCVREKAESDVNRQLYDLLMENIQILA